MTSSDFLLNGAAAAEAPPSADKLVVSDPINVVDKPVVSDDGSAVAEKLVIADDSFVFTDKQVVSESVVGISSLDGDFVIDQDVMAEFLAQAQTDFDLSAYADGRYELSLDAELNHHDYFTDFFSIV